MTSRTVRATALCLLLLALVPVGLGAQSRQLRFESLGVEEGLSQGHVYAVTQDRLGFLWIAFDPRKQGWHDKLAGTVVVNKVPGDTTDG